MEMGGTGESQLSLRKERGGVPHLEARRRLLNLGDEVPRG